MKSRYTRLAEAALDARRWQVIVWTMFREQSVVIYARNAAVAEEAALRHFGNTVIRAITYSELR